MFFEPIYAVTWKPMHFQLLDHYIQFRPPPIAQDPSFIPKYAVPPMSKLLDQTIRFRTFPRSKVLYQNMQSLQSQRFWTKTYRFAPPPLEPTFHTKISTYSDLHLDKSIPFRVSLDPKFYTKICSHSDQASRPKFKCCVPFTHEPHFWTKIHLGRNLERNKCSPCFRP